MISFLLGHRFYLFFYTAILLSPILGSPTNGRKVSDTGPTCQDLFIPLTATSLNREINDSVLTDTTSVANLLVSLAASNGTYSYRTQHLNVSARFCEPEIKIPGRYDSVQLLVHGITYTKNYWSALGFPGYQPDHYSWIHYASKRGYPTLSIDRPGNGNSTRPDPFSGNQVSLHAGVLRQIAQGLRTGQILGREFRKVIYIGHSMGSAIGNAVATAYPESVDAMVLTGYTEKPTSNLVLAADPIPATSFLPRFAGLSTGYVATSNNLGRQAAFYGRNGTYDPQIADLDFSTQDTVAIGELATMSAKVAANYTGPVVVITGEQDAAWCFVNATVRGYCGRGDASKPAQVRHLFPNASTFSYFVPEGVGHDINAHYRAPIAYAYAHDWLQSHGF